MRCALITGATRGIGREVARQLAVRGHRVLVGCRERAAGDAVVQQLIAAGGDAQAVVLDVTSASSVSAAVHELALRSVDVDILINNAGVCPSGNALDADEAAWRDALDVNVLGVVRVSRALVPGMVARGYGRVVNVTSSWGLFSEGMSGPAPYAVSKAALDAYTCTLARAVRGDIKVNAVDPGWVKTDMGGSSAPRTVERGAETIVWLATIGADGPHGGVFRDKRRLAW